ncbi:hypothetical protein FO519_006336 [Halicephalobus sp. NKZ332]|nr:hypothetical protein FO519_006336 [Halicephalobus sp. NKZ332]
MVAEAEGVQYAIINGIFRKSSIEVRFILWDFWAFCNALTMSALSVEFVYRYLLLCKNKTISLKLYLLMFGGALIGAILFGLNGWIGYFIAGKNDTIKAESSLGWILKDDDGRVGAVGAIAHGTFQCYFAMLMAILLSFGSYSIIVYCTWKIFTFMKENEQVFSKSVRNVNRDLNKMLFIQATCPIFSYVMPIGIFAVGLLFPTTPIAIPGLISSMAFSWAPAGNAASILGAVTAYRRALFSIITSKEVHLHKYIHKLVYLYISITPPITMSTRSPGVRRLMQEAKELSEPTDMYIARPLEENLFEWHFTIRGPPDSPYEGGLYHGRIILPDVYPHKPPNFVILTPNGRFETNTKICLSISSYHPETWLPSWSIGTALVALIAFFSTPGKGAVGSLECSDQQRRKLAQDSLKWTCSTCGCKMSEIFEELKTAEGKKPCAELPPTNPDVEEESTPSEVQDPSTAVQPEPVVEAPSPPIIQPQPQLRAPIRQEVHQETNNSSTVAILIFFFTALFFGLAYRRLISV